MKVLGPSDDVCGRDARAFTIFRGSNLKVIERYSQLFVVLHSIFQFVSDDGHVAMVKLLQYNEKGRVENLVYHGAW